MAPYELVVGTVDLTVPRDGLLTLDEAAELPRLGGLFKARDLRRYASPTRKVHRLPAVQPGRVYMTTPAWVDAWVDGMLPGAPAAAAAEAASAPAPAATSASVALEARLAKLRARGQKRRT